MGLKAVIITKGSLLCIAVRSSNRVTSNTRNSGLGVRNDLSTLDVEALDLCKRVPNELSHHCEHLASVNSLALAVEGCIALTV